MKFSNKLSFTIFMSGMIALILLSFTIYKFSYNSIIKTQFMYTKSIAIEVSDNIDHLLEEKIKTALTLANTPVIKNELEMSNFFYTKLSGEKRKESINLLNEKWKSTKDPADGFILKFTDNKVSRFLKDQQAVLKSEYGEIFLTNKFGALVASTTKLSTFAHGHKYWWLGSYDNGKGAVFFDDRGYDDSVDGYVLGLIVPVRKGAEIIGILKCNLNILGSISQLISGAEDKLIGKFKLTRSGGMIVFEEGFEPLSTRIHDSIPKRLKNKNEETFILNDSGEKYLVGLSEIELTKGEKGYGFGGTFQSIDHKKGNTGESWYVVGYREMSTALSPAIESTKWITLIGFAIIAVLVAVSYLFGQKIAKPLEKLNKATNIIGKGDFKHRINIRRNDEIGSLAHSFNNMANKLQENTTTVEVLENEIRHRKETEKALQRSEEKYRTILSSIEDGYYEMDVAGNLTFSNDSLCKIFGYSKSELMERNYRQYTDEENAKKLYQTFNKVYKTGKPDKGFDWEIVTKDNEARHIETSVSLRKDLEGKPIGFQGIVRNITEKKFLQAQLQQAQKMESIGTLAGGIAHNFNNLLMGILGNASLMLMDIDSEHPHSKYLNNIKDQVHSGSKLTSQLIGFAREGSYEVKPVNLNRLVKETSDTFGMAKKDVTVHQELSEKLYGIKADQGQIEQVLLNLFVNAADAMPGGGDLFLKTINVTDKDITGKLYKVKPGKYALLTVRDTGTGMDKETRERIFEPFFTTKGLASGTGLGMASAYGIIKGHGGYIDFDSDKGKGTTFSIYLPATEKEIKMENVLPDELVKGKGIILLVDDEEMVLDAGGQMLEYLGYEVLTAKDGKKAIELYKENRDRIDMVLLDMVMPVTGGGESFDRMKEMNPEVKVLLSSGYSIDGEAKEIIKRGCNGFIQKPFTMEKLSNQIKSILDMGNE